MPRIQKKSPLQRLSTFQTLVVDTNPNSTYFKISEIPDQLTAGKNAFLIEGTPYLRKSTDIKIEVLDVDGNPLFVEPGEGIPEYYEGLSKLISVHVYASTPIGVGKITILGELETYIDDAGLEKEVPDVWEDVYNVKWEKDIKINKNVPNETRVRFVQRPSVIIEETGESFYSRNVTSSIQTNGTVRGLAITPIEGTDLSTWGGGIQYLIQNESNDFVDNGKRISISNTSIENADILEYVTQRSVIVQVPNTSSQNIITNFTHNNYELVYEYASSIAESDLFGSFARFEVNSLKTFVGDVERLKVYARSRATSADYYLLHDTKIDSSNLLTVVVSGSSENIGYFTSSYSNNKSYTHYWTTQSSANVSLDTQALYKSVKFQNNKITTNLGTAIRLERGSEYTLEFYTYYSGSTINDTDALKIFLTSTLRSGVGIPNYIITSSVATIYGNKLYKTPTKLSYNFIPDSTDYWSINFEAVNPNSDTFWQVGSVLLEGSNELGYSPDEYTFTVPIIRQIEQETYDFRFEWFDINNNFVPITNTGTQTFVSGNLTLLGKNLSVDADKLFFTFNASSQADPDNQIISLVANKAKLAGNLLITSQAFDTGGIYITPASFLGNPYPGTLTSTYEDATIFSGSLTIANFTGSLHGAPPSPGDVIVDRILYTFTEANSTQPQTRRLSVSRVLTGTGSAGAAGTDAKSVSLVSNIYAIAYDSNNNEIGTNNIWLTASQQNHNGVVYYEFLKNDVSKQNTTSQYYNVLTADKPTSASRDSWKVNTREGSSGGSIVAFDTLDLFGLKSGDNGYTVFLTNAATTFPASDTGVVSTDVLSTGTTDVVFYKGTQQFTYDQTSPYDTNSYRTGSIVSSSGITYTTSVVGSNLRITPTTINTNSGTLLSGSLTIPIVDNDNTLNFILTYNYSVAKAGSSGSNALSIVVNPSTQIVSKSVAGTYKSPVTFSVQVFETGSPLLYTGSNNTLQNGYFTIFAGTAASMGTLLPATGSLSASIIPPNVTTDSGTTSSFAVRYRDSKGNLSSFISQSHFIGVVSDGRDGASGSNAVSIELIPTTQTVTASLALGTYSTASQFNVRVYETGSLMRYTTTQPPTTRGTWTIYMSGVGSNGTNNSLNNETSGTITPPLVTAIRPHTSSFAVQYLDSKGNLSEFVSQSHVVNVVSVGQTGPGIVFTGPWSSSRTYQYSEGSANGRRDAVISGSSNRYYATKQQHIADSTNYPGFGVGETNSNAFWEYLGTEDAFVAAKIAIFKESYVQNTLNVGTTNYEQGFSKANITIAGGTEYPYISIGQTPSTGYNNNGIWLGNDSGIFRMSLTSGSTNFLRWTGTTLEIAGSINVTGGDAATQTFSQTAANNVNTSASAYSNNVNSSASLYSSNVNSSASLYANNAALTGSNSASAVSASLQERIYTDSTGRLFQTPSPTGQGLFLGSKEMGYYSSSNTPQWSTFISSSGDFYLRGAGAGFLQWIANLSQLTVAGNIIVQGGNAPTTSSVSSSINTATSSLSASLEQRIFTDTNGRLIKPPVEAATSGLYIGNTYMGYYNGSAWRTYMDNTGKFFLTGTGASSLTWDGTSLTITGSVVATSGKIGGLTISSQSVFIGNGIHANSGSSFFVSSSGDFSLGDAVVWTTGSNLFSITKGQVTIGDVQTGVNTSISPSGLLYTQNAEINGTVNASAGTIGGWSIASTTLTAGTSSAGNIKINSARPSVEFYSGSTLVVDVSGDTRLSNTGSTTLIPTASFIATGSKVGSSDNNTGGNIAARYLNVTANYASGSTTRLTGSFTSSFIIDGANDGALVTISCSFANSSSFSASFQARVDSAYYLSNTSFSLRYGVGLYKSESLGNVFIDASTRTATGTPTYTLNSERVSNVISYSGTGRITRTLAQGTYYLIPFVDLISVSATAELDEGACNCPTAGTFYAYGDCVGGQQEVIRYTGNCDAFDNCTFYTSYEGACL
jgi:hypothetical protein